MLEFTKAPMVNNFCQINIRLSNYTHKHEQSQFHLLKYKLNS